jgi:hypothetical protein
MNAIEKQVNILAKKLPDFLGSFVLQYWKDKNRILSKKTRLTNLQRSLPYWFILPRAILYHHKINLNAKDKRFLNDIVWAQYCLYFAIRIQDDIYDGQIKNNAMLFISDLFLLEAETIFQKYFESSSSFWKIERECYNLTLSGILEVKRFQDSLDGDPDKLLAEYANVSSVLKVGSAAVCSRLSIMNVYKKISKFSDEMALASQIIDDFEDIKEDLRYDRFNYAVKYLLNVSKEATKKSQNIIDLLQSTTNENRIARLSAKIYHHLAKAEKIALGLAVPELIEHVRYFRKCYDAKAKRLYERMLDPHAKTWKGP